MRLSNPMTLSMALALAAASAANAQSAPPAPGTAPRTPPAALPTAPADVTMTVQESEALDQLHAANVLEIAAGKLAIKNASSADVKKYGAHLVNDHTKADRDLLAGGS